MVYAVSQVQGQENVFQSQPCFLDKTPKEKHSQRLSLHNNNVLLYVLGVNRMSDLLFPVLEIVCAVLQPC